MNPNAITVKLAPEKKGLFLKHSEYEITSQNHNATVFRRYNDFVTLHSFLLTRFPYRMIPRLPPKQLMLDSLLEERRRGLQRWLNIVIAHVALGACPLVARFLTDQTAEHQEHLRDASGREHEEFAELGEDVELPLEEQGRLAESREMMRTLLNGIRRWKHLIDQQTLRQHNEATSLHEMSSILILLASKSSLDEGIFTETASGLKEVANIAEKSANLSREAITERINVLLDVLTSHSDLCDRVEKGIVSDHQRALSKMLHLNKQKMKGVIRGTAAESVASLHEREVAQTGVVGSLGRRSAFSLHCLLQETSVAEEYLKVLPSIMLSFSYEQNRGHSQMAKIWENIVHSESDRI